MDILIIFENYKSNKHKLKLYTLPFGIRRNSAKTTYAKH